MTAILPSITEANLFKALGDFISSIVDCQVIRAQVNRTAMPPGDFVSMTQSSSAPLSTNIDSNTSNTKSVKAPTRWGAQIDCYGAQACDRAKAITALLRDDYACQQFAASGYDIQPLYASDAQQMPLITGEQQYLERWTFEIALQYNGILTVSQDTADALVVGLINVDATYKP